MCDVSFISAKIVLFGFNNAMSIFSHINCYISSLLIHRCKKRVLNCGFFLKKGYWPLKHRSAVSFLIWLNSALAFLRKEIDQNSFFPLQSVQSFMLIFSVRRIRGQVVDHLLLQNLCPPFSLSSWMY